MWRSLLAFVKFLTAYADELRSITHIEDMVDDLVKLITLALIEGESFLPDSAAYDDLFYKLVETGDSITSLRDAYALDKSACSEAIGTLIGVSKHYSNMIDEAKAKSRKHLGPKEVSKIIKQGYDTLEIPIEARDGLGQWTAYREADHKVFLRHCARAAVSDARVLSMLSV